ncbi:MAG: hypothetical protein ACIAS6_10245 [Phycisphaerales bacterium JB060]
MATRASSRWVWIVLPLWAVTCLVAFGALWRYGNTPGDPGGMLEGWTVPASLEVATDRPTLLVFAHPKCPCTRATMAAIERLQRDVLGGFETRVVFFEPQDAGPDWRRTELWQRAERLRDVRVLPDPGGRLVSRAGAVVSGTVALLDVDGRLLFWGGLTSSRGHEGDSVGSLAVRAILRGEDARTDRTPVYGCVIIAGEGVADG